MKKYLLITGLCAMRITLCAQADTTVPEEADAIYYNAKVYTVTGESDIQQAFAVKNGKFLKVGSDAEILKRYTSVQKTDLGGMTVFPGFIDAHCHFYGYGLGLLQLDLTGTKSWDEVLEKLKVHATSRPSGWLIGRGWDQNDWAVRQYPDNSELNRLFPERPVVLKRIDGHAVIANNKALQLAGINAGTQVQGGQVLLQNGIPTGILIDNAVDLLDKVIPKPDGPLIAESLLRAQKNCLAAGLTTVDDAGLDVPVVKIIDSLQKTQRLKINVYAMLNPTEEGFAFAMEKGIYITPRLTVRSFKLYTDGSLGSRGALLKQPYCDQKEHFGLQFKSQGYLDSVCKRIYKLKYQVCSHAIGDSANRLILNAYQQYLTFESAEDRIENNRNIGKNNSGGLRFSKSRWRVEHAQVMDISDMKLFHQYIIPSVQPTHATSDMYWAKDRICAERMPGAYAYKSLLKHAGCIALGTDFPVEDISPIKTFYAAVFRKDLKGYPDSGFQMKNALSRFETLKGMTYWAAYANFEEMRKGTISEGKQADFIVLDTDIMTAPETAVLNTRVLRTVVFGETVYTVKP